MTFALAAAKAPPFNGLFYATAATVIPVLFLAVAMQSTTYRDLLAAAGSLGKRNRDILATIAFGIAALVLISGAAGEITAIVVLQGQQADSGLDDFVGAAVIALIVVTAAAPTQALVRTMLEAWRREKSRRAWHHEHTAGTAPGEEEPPGKPPASEADGTPAVAGQTSEPSGQNGRPDRTEDTAQAERG